MPRHVVRLVNDRSYAILRTWAACSPANVPNAPGYILPEYHKGAPYPGTIRAKVMAGRRCREYELHLKDDIADVCRHVARVPRSGMLMSIGEPPGSAESPDAESPDGEA